MSKLFEGNRIHLLEKKNNYVRIDDVANTWESKGWKITEANAERLVGGAIYLHKAKTVSSFIGGLIESYRIETEGDFVGKVTFTFHFEIEFKAVRAGGDGWKVDKKMVFPEKPSEQTE